MQFLTPDSDHEYASRAEVLKAFLAGTPFRKAVDVTTDRSTLEAEGVSCVTVFYHQQSRSVDLFVEVTEDGLTWSCAAPKSGSWVRA